MLCRTWDRIEQRLTRPLESHDIEPWDIFAHAKVDKRSEGIIDDIRDLRRYLTLVGVEQRRIAMGRPEGEHLSLLADLAGDDLRFVHQWEIESEEDSSGVEAGKVLRTVWGILEEACGDGFGGWRSVFDVNRELVDNVRLCLLGIEGTLRRDGVIHGAHRDNA